MQPDAPPSGLEYDRKVLELPPDSIPNLQTIVQPEIVPIARNPVSGSDMMRCIEDVTEVLLQGLAIAGVRRLLRESDRPHGLPAGVEVEVHVIARDKTGRWIRLSSDPCVQLLFLGLDRDLSGAVFNDRAPGLPICRDNGYGEQTARAQHSDHKRFFKYVPAGTKRGRRHGKHVADLGPYSEAEKGQKRQTKA